MKNTVSVLMGLSLLAFHAYSAESRPSFHGAWQLNQELSEDPREKMMQAMGGGGGMGGGRRRTAFQLPIQPGASL